MGLLYYHGLPLGGWVLHSVGGEVFRLVPNTRKKKYTNNKQKLNLEGLLEEARAKRASWKRDTYPRIGRKEGRNWIC